MLWDPRRKPKLAAPNVVYQWDRAPDADGWTLDQKYIHTPKTPPGLPDGVWQSERYFCINRHSWQNIHKAWFIWKRLFSPLWTPVSAISPVSSSCHFHHLTCLPHIFTIILLHSFSSSWKPFDVLKMIITIYLQWTFPFEYTAPTVANRFLIWSEYDQKIHLVKTLQTIDLASLLHGQKPPPS